MTVLPPREVILECIQLGGTMKVVAIDPQSGLEVSFQAHPKTNQNEIKRLALSKLTYVLNRQSRKD